MATLKGSITIVDVQDGATGPQGEQGEQGISVTKVVREYTKSSSSTSLPENPSWSETEPTIGANEYLWARDRTDLSNGTSTYGTAVCSTNISGVKHDVDKANKAITDKVWESDITTKIDSYDSSTVSTIRDKVSEVDQNLDGITSRVSSVESTTSDLGTRMSTAETTIDQTANNVLIKATKSDTTAAQGGQHLIQSLINVAPSGVTISADKVNIEGATIFSSGRLSQTSLNNAYAGKSTALSDSIPIYYRSPSSTTPTISTSTTIGTSNNTDNSWTYVMPIPKRNSYFFTCERQVHPDGSVTFSTVRPLDSQTYASKWVSSADNTYIDGGRLYAHSVTTGQLATDAIKSNNYQAAASGPYSVTGTFLDLSNGNFYTPNFGVQSLTGKAYLNGEIIATSGSIGDDSGNYWSIGNTIDSQGNGSASIVGNGTAYIQDGDWQIHSGLSNYSNGSINTQWYIQPQGQGLQLTYPYYDGYYYDYGMTSPVLDANSDRFYNQTVSQNFLYIRKHASTIPALESDWNYVFRVDKDGMIWINGQSLTQMIEAGVDGGAYLPTSGGTVNGNVTITGTLTATASKASQLTHTLSINGKGFDGSGDVNVGTIGAAYGGTGQTSLVNSANALLNALDTGSSTPVDADYYISQYVGGGTTTTTYHRRPMSALWAYIKSKISSDSSVFDDVYVAKSGDTMTGSLTVENGIYSDSAQLGDLIVTGAGRFANGLYGDLIGNADTATKATKVADSGNGNDITLNYSGTNYSTVSWFAAWNGYQLGAISPANVLKTIGADKSASISDRINVTGSGNYNWTSSTNDDKLITSNTLAYWNGAYRTSDYASNIEYVKLGKLGALSIKDSLSASDVGLGNLTNNKQVKGLSSGTTFGHFVTWGADGYTVADSGITAGNVVKSVASNASGQLVLTYADNTTSAPIDVEFVATETSSVQKAEALNVNGTAVGGVDEPVYFDNQGKPTKANKIPKLNNNITGGTFYAPTGAGTSGQILQSSGGTPSWVNQNTIAAGTATKFSSTRKIELTGDTTGSVSSDGSGGWSISTVTNQINAVSQTLLNTQEAIDGFLTPSKFQFGMFKTSEQNDLGFYGNDGLILSLPWGSINYGAQIAIDDNTSSTIKFRGKATNWGDWRTIIHDKNYSSYALPLSGGSLTGSLTFDNVTNAIYYNGTKATYSMIRFKDNTSDAYGNGIVIGGGGMVVIGGGESSDKVANTHTSGGDEVLDLASDGDVYIWTNVQDGAETAKKFNFDINGVLGVPNHVLSYSPFTITNGKVTELTTNPRGGLFSNGVAFTNPTTRNDVGWIRMLGTGESDTIMEIATGDDASEQIFVRQYNTSSAVVHELKLLDASGNTSVPKDLSIGGHVTLSYSSTTESLDFIFN